MEQIYGSWVEYRLQQGAEEEERSNGDVIGILSHSLYGLIPPSSADSESDPKWFPCTTWWSNNSGGIRGDSTIHCLCGQWDKSLFVILMKCFYRHFVDVLPLLLLFESCPIPTLLISHPFPVCFLPSSAPDCLFPVAISYRVCRSLGSWYKRINMHFDLCLDGCSPSAPPRSTCSTHLFIRSFSFSWIEWIGKFISWNLQQFLSSCLHLTIANESSPSGVGILWGVSDSLLQILKELREQQ